MRRKGREVKTMKKIMYFLLAAIVFAGFQTAVAQSPVQVRVNVGKDKKESRSKITIKFVSVDEDSRCPEGANCMWAGTAKVTVKIRRGSGAWKSLQISTGTEPSALTFEGYELKVVTLTPSPSANSKLDPKRYVATVSLRTLN